MTDEPDKTDKSKLDLKKWRKRAVLAGIVLAVVCKSLPEDYRAICDALATFCTGGLG